MPSFIELIAGDIIERFRGNTEDIRIIFPNKRPGLYFSEALAKRMRKTVWMPEIMTFGEFTERNTGYEIADETTLLIKLYKSYSHISGTNENFDSFYFWGNMLLSDFDDIDKYRVNADALFSNLSALKDIDRTFPRIPEEDLKAIRQFWKSLNTENLGKGSTEFLKVWQYLAPTYHHFKKELEKEKLCYEGMGEILLCERLKTMHTDKTVIFAGFNALNKCEEYVFSFFKNTGKALFYWDYDRYYTENPEQEAGFYIRKNLKLFPNAIEARHFDNFTKNKDIEYISVPSTMAGPKIIPALIKDFGNVKGKETGIILCDESLLVPVLFSLPPEIEKANVTMGYPGGHTATAALISLIAGIKRERDKNTFYYRPVLALLDNPLIRTICPEKAEAAGMEIRKCNMIYIPYGLLAFHPLTEIIFGGKGIRDMLPEFIELLYTEIQAVSEKRPGETTDMLDIEKESAFNALATIRQIDFILRKEGMEIGDDLYIRIISTLIKNTNLPFSGESLEGVQIMGLMESRMIDFKNLIIVSANENKLPKSGISNSYIPHNLRCGFGLPSFEKREAMFAYYFYRLLQRAENIKIIYSSLSSGTKSEEMSRFLYQIKFESGLPVREGKLQQLVSVNKPETLTIKKDEHIMAKIALLGSSASPLSPSAVNKYMECRLKFYFRYIAGIKPAEEMEEEVDHRLLGNIFHDTMEHIYAPYRHTPLNSEHLLAICGNKIEIKNAVRNAYIKSIRQNNFPESGINELILETIEKYIRHCIKYDARYAPFEKTESEKNCSAPVEISPGVVKYIGGRIDRMDITEKEVRIIDYKTGNDTPAVKSLDSLFDREYENRNKAAFQTLVYALIVSETSPETLPLIPGIYNAKSITASQRYDYRIQIEGKPLSDFRTQKEVFLNKIRSLLREIFDPAADFNPTASQKRCKTCEYARICLKN